MSPRRPKPAKSKIFPSPEPATGPALLFVSAEMELNVLIARWLRWPQLLPHLWWAQRAPVWSLLFHLCDRPLRTEMCFEMFGCSYSPIFSFLLGLLCTCTSTCDMSELRRPPRPSWARWACICLCLRSGNWQCLWFQALKTVLRADSRVIQSNTSLISTHQSDDAAIALKSKSTSTARWNIVCLESHQSSPFLFVDSLGEEYHARGSTRISSRLVEVIHAP